MILWKNTYVLYVDIYEGDAPPEVCPVCKVGADKFEQVQGEMQWADEHRIGIAKDIDNEIIEGLRANFIVNVQRLVCI